MEVCPDLCVTGALPPCIIDENAKQIIRQGRVIQHGEALIPCRAAREQRTALGCPLVGKI